MAPHRFAEGCLGIPGGDKPSCRVYSTGNRMWLNKYTVFDYPYPILNTVEIRQSPTQYSRNKTTLHSIPQKQLDPAPNTAKITQSRTQYREK